MEIKEGMDVTESLYVDRACYYMTKVVSQKQFFAKPYFICADHEHAKGMGHQNWLYFKTAKEINEYLKGIFPEDSTEYKENEHEIEFVFRYNHWNKVYIDSDNKRCYERVVLAFDIKNYYYDWEF